MQNIAPVRLRQARESAGLHIAALAAALKVPVKKLEALEAGRYEELPDMTFARALASSACRHLKVDPAAVLEQIPLAHRPALGDSPQTINAPFKDGAEVATGGWLVGLMRPVGLIVTALLLGAIAVYFWPAAQAPAVPEAVLPPSQDMAPGVAPTTVLEPVGSPATAEVQSASSTAVVTPTAADTAAQAPAGAVQAASPEAPASPDAQAGSPALLHIAVSGDSWIEVVNGKGEVVVQRLLKTGDALDFSSAPPYAVVIGRADVAQVSVRGQAFDVMPYARNSVARFEVK